jgi:hypothetical protein
MTTCSHVNNDGKRCKAYAVRDSSDNCCVFHSADPQIKELMRRARASSKGKSPRLRVPKTLDDMKRLLADLIARAAAGEVPESRVLAVKQLVSSYLRLADLGEVQRRLEQLEAKNAKS